ASSHASCRAISPAVLPGSIMPLGMTQRRPLLEVTRQTLPARIGMAAAWESQSGAVAMCGPSAGPLWGSLKGTARGVKHHASFSRLLPHSDTRPFGLDKSAAGTDRPGGGMRHLSTAGGLRKEGSAAKTRNRSRIAQPFVAD